MMFLGVDSGGTKTDFILISRSGEIIATHTEPTTYYHQVGLETAKHIIKNGVEAVCAQANIVADNIIFGFFGIASYGENRVITKQLDELPAQILKPKLSVVKTFETPLAFSLRRI